MLSVLRCLHTKKTLKNLLSAGMKDAHHHHCRRRRRHWTRQKEKQLINKNADRSSV